MLMLPYPILIAFICAAMNHMGLIAAAEKVLHFRLPILNCPRCSAFWLTLIAKAITLELFEPLEPLNFLPLAIGAVAIAFVASYLAMWIELAMGGLTQMYNYVYDKIYPTAANAAGNATAAEREESTNTEDNSSSTDAMPEVRNVS